MTHLQDRRSPRITIQTQVGVHVLRGRVKAAGTLSYMSLEARQCDVSRKGDMLSVGVMLWNIMIGGYGDENFDKAHAPFGFEHWIYHCDSRGQIIEYPADQLYEKIQEKSIKNIIS